MAEHSAYQSRSVVTHLDGLTTARTTKLTIGAKPYAEGELLEVVPQTSHAMEAEFHGGVGVDVEGAEDELFESTVPADGVVQPAH